MGVLVDTVPLVKRKRHLATWHDFSALLVVSQIISNVGKSYVIVS